MAYCSSSNSVDFTENLYFLSLLFLILVANSFKRQMQVPKVLRYYLCYTFLITVLQGEWAVKFEASWICFFQQNNTKRLYCAGGFDNVGAAAHCQACIIRILFSHLDVDLYTVCELCKEGNWGDKRLHNMHTHIRNIFLNS